MIPIKTVLRHRTLWILLWILWMGVIFAFSQMSGSPSFYEPTIQILLERKGAHVVEYAVLLLLSVQVFSLYFYKESLRQIATLSAVWCLAYGALDELHQFFSPFRGAHLQDVGIDGIGILIALGFVALIYSAQRKKTR